MSMRDTRILPGVREVVCMFCTWTWLTGTSSNTEAQCPRCGYRAGVEVFVVMKPGVEGFVVISTRGAT
jgi:DNA-directed RNA polymerase subunit RPC12/RpoP